MVKRILAISLLCTMCFSICAGCKQKEDGSLEFTTNIQEIDFGAMADNVTKQVTDGFNNIKDSALKTINSEVEKFMEEHNIPKEKANEVAKMTKEWAKMALTASGEIDKAKGSLKQYLSDHLDELTTVSSEVSK